MELMKKILIHILIIIIILCSAISVYYASKNDLPVYADTTIDDWRNLSSTQDYANAFRAYCKSRDLTIEGSFADGVTSFTTNTFNGLCNSVGIDITALQGEIKYRTDGNAGLQYLFSTTGVTAYNRLFSQFLQDNDLEVGDSATPQNNVLYSGKYFTDSEGYSCYVFICNTANFVTGAQHGEDWTIGNRIDEIGSPYKYRTNELVNLCMDTSNGVYQFTTPLLNTRSYNIYKVQLTFNNRYRYICLGDMTNTIKIIETYNNAPDYDCYGYYGIFYNPDTDRYYLGCYCYGYLSNMSTPYSYVVTPVVLNLENDVQSLNIYVTTNNTVINNNNYQGDTIINNNGDVINDNDTYNPYPDGGGTTTPSGNTGGGSGEDDTDVTFPNFNFQIPEINWSLGDLSNKFPFSIPFDLVEFLTVLNAEPVAPKFEGDLNLAIVNYHYDFDFEQFDSLAQILRNMEFIGFCIGLILITRQMIRV